MYTRKLIEESFWKTTPPPPKKKKEEEEEEEKKRKKENYLETIRMLSHKRMVKVDTQEIGKKIFPPPPPHQLPILLKAPYKNSLSH